VGWFAYEFADWQGFRRHDVVGHRARFNVKQSFLTCAVRVVDGDEGIVRISGEREFPKSGPGAGSSGSDDLSIRLKIDGQELIGP
jgi:hypothetical protein